MRLLITAVAISLALLATSRTVSARAPKPNIVVVYLDDRDDYWSRKAMPKTQQLIAQQGIIFKNSFVSTPLCGPSRASFLTGQMAHNHGIWVNSNRDGGGWSAMRKAMPNSLGVWMQEAGYKTAVYGKLMNGFSNREGETVPGFDDYAIYRGPGGTGTRYFDYQLYENGSLLSYGANAEDYITDVLADKAEAFVRDATGPFFMVLAPLAPHSPAIPAPRHAGYHATAPLPMPSSFNEPNNSDKPLPLRDVPQFTLEQIEEITQSHRNRLESMMSVDEAVEQIITTLSATGKLDNTIIAFTSDNGMSLGEYRWTGKLFPYDVTARVPLLIRGPGIPAGEKRYQFVNNLDLTATIVELAGAAPGRLLDGKSLVPLLQPTGAAAPWRSGVLIESDLNSNELPDGYRYHAVRKRHIMFGEVRNKTLGTMEREAYDMDNDPSQEVNMIATTPQDVQKRWIALLNRLKVCQGTQCSDF